MSLASIILVLQVAVSLLVNPNLANNLAAKQQAVDFANQAIALANQALQQPVTTSLQDTVSTSTPPAFPSISSDTVAGTGAGTGTETVAPVQPTSTPVVPKTIQVIFSANSDEGFVTITNTTGVTVRIKNLDVTSGTLAGISFGKTYGDGYVYSGSFADSLGNTFNRFSCNGLGSLGQAVQYGGSVDPCARKDGSGAINELQAGEMMILRYTGSPSGVTYQTGSIVEAGNGSDVTF
jgi:hypothetical protein